jgi:glyoxylase-like metal-dependent hydrolase (beta-lactamase superfamily II)
MLEHRVLAIKYGSRPADSEEIYLNYSSYGRPNQSPGMDYFVWAIQDESGVTMVDTGFSEAAWARRGRKIDQAVADRVRAAGIEPEDVGRLILTHCHYDHIGNVSAFPNAHVFVAADDYEFWSGPYAKRAQFAPPVPEDSEISYLTELRAQGRLSMVPEPYWMIAPGIAVLRVGGHSPGQLMVVVRSASGTVLLTSDVVHYYEELENDMPMGVVVNLLEMYQGYEMVRNFVAQDNAVVVPGHDPDVMKRFPLIREDDPGLGVVVSSTAAGAECGAVARTANPSTAV